MIDGNGAPTEVADPDVAEVANPEADQVLDPQVTAPERGTGDEVEGSPSSTGWRSIGEGIREMGRGMATVARAGWQKARAVLPGAETPVGLTAWIVGALVVVVAVVAVAATALESAPSVVVATAGPATINAQPGGVGTTTPAQNLSSSVGLNIVGVTAPITVTGVDVINGSSVQKGQPLLSLDPTPLQQNQASIQSQLSAAQFALALAQAPNAPAQSPEALNSLQGQVAIDKQLLAIAQGYSTTLNAPIAGSVTNLSVQPGQVVPTGNTMLQIVNTSRINVVAGLQLSDMQAVAVGQSADIVPTGLVGVHLAGTVVAINPNATGGGLQGSVVIETNNIPSNSLPIGTQVFVRITATRHAAVSVPRIAVQNLDLAPSVFVVSHGRVHITPVTVGAVDANRAQILSGLSAGEVVAETNTQLLTDGEQVKIG